LGNGGGGAGPSANQGWTNIQGVGINFNPNGSEGTNPANYNTAPTEPVGGGATVFRQSQAVAGAPNTYTGLTTITAGTILIVGGASLPDASNVNVTANGTLDLNGFSETTGSLSGAGLVTSSANNGLLTTGGDNSSTTYTGVASGSLGLTKTGSGTMTLSGTNTYTLATTVSGTGTLQLGAAGGFSDSSAFTVNNTATLALNNITETIGSLAGTGNVTLGAGTLTTGGSNASTNYTGIMSGTGGLTKIGTGTQSIGGANTYDGVTTISSGTLRLSTNGVRLGSTVAGTTISSGATLDLSQGGLQNDEILTVTGTGVGGNGAIISNNGNFNDAWSNLYKVVVVGDTLSLGGNTRFNFRNGTGGYIYNSVNGTPFNVVKGGSGRVIFSITDAPDLNNFAINAGDITFDNTNAAGNSTGTVTVANGATLGFSGSVTNTKNVVVQAGGLVRNDAGTATLNGTTFTLSGATRIDVINNASLVINSRVTGTGALTKTGNGFYTPANVTNDNSGLTTITDGMLIATHDRALGTTAAGTVVSGTGSLNYDGTYTFPVAETLTISGTGLNGQGALVKYNGIGTISQNISIPRNATIGNAMAGASNKLILAGNLQVAPVANLTFTGAGDIEVTNSFGNGAVASTVDGIMHFGYHLNNDGVVMNLNNNGGMVNGGAPGSYAGLHGAYLRTGTVQFYNDGDFINSGAVNQGDNFSNLFLTKLHVTAANAGVWNFRIAQQDDPTGIWLDLNQNGVFESDGSLNSNRNEQLRWNNTSNVQVTLAAGDYTLAFTHRESGGGSAIDARFQSPTMGAEAPVGAAANPGIFKFITTPLTTVTKTGTGTTTFLAANTYNGLTTISGGTLAIANADALGNTGTAGTVVAFGATLGLKGGITLANEPSLTVNGLGATGQPGALVNLSEDNTVSMPIVYQDVNLGNVGIGSTLGTLTLAGNINERYSKTTFNGAGSVIVNGVISSDAVSSTVEGIMHFGYHLNNDGVVMNLNNNGGMVNGGAPGSYAGLYGAYLRTGTVQFYNDGDFINSGAVNQADNYSNLFLTTLHVSAANAGVWNFRIAQQDDPSGIWLDLNQNGVFESSGTLGNNQNEQLRWNDTSNVQVTLAAGDYTLAFTHREAGGGSVIDARFQSPTMGAEAPVGAAANPGIFKFTLTADNKLIKNGSGTVTLNAANTYTGTTTINNGTLVVTNAASLGATGVGSGTVVTSGGTLQIDGVFSFPVAESLTIAGAGAGGVGAINKTGGDGTISQTITLTGSATFGSGTANNKLTIDGALVIAQVADVTFTGAGNIDVSQAFGNVGVVPPSGLTGKFYQDGSAGALDSINPVSGNVLNVEALTPLFTVISQRIDFGDGTETNPGDGTVLDRGGDSNNHFGGIGVSLPNNNNNIAAVWTGYINIPETANYTFTTRSDDGSRLWIDINGNNSFSDSGDMIVDNNFSQGMTNRSNTSNGGNPITLTAGVRAIKVGFNQGGGGWGVQLSWSKDTGSNTFGRTIISPAYLYATPPTINNVFKTGTGTVNLLGNNTYNGNTTVSGGALNLPGNNDYIGTTTVNSGTLTLSGNNANAGLAVINGGTLVASNSGALGSATAGTNVLGSGTLSLSGGITIADNITVGANATIRNLLDTNTLTGNISTNGTASSTLNLLSNAGQLNVNGNIALGLAVTTVNTGGTGNIVMNGDITTGSAYAGYVQGKNALAYYPLDEISGTTAFDAHSNPIVSPINGTLVNGPTQGAATNPGTPLLGTAYTFNGTNQSVTLGTTDQLGIFNQSFTAAAWIKPTGANLNGDKSIFGTGVDNNIGLHLILRNGEPHFGFFNNDSTSGPALNLDQWYFVTWVYDAGAQTQQIFIDGQPRTASGGHAPYAGTGQPVSIGSWNGANFFEGSIDEPVFFGAALTPTDILDLYNSGSQSSSGSVNFNKTGSGSVTLAHSNGIGIATNTTVSGGRLVANNTTGSALGTGNIAVNAGTLEGTGSVSGNTTVTGTLGAGDNGTGTFTLDGATTFASGGGVNIDLRGSTQGATSSGYDLITTSNTGLIDLDNATLTVTLGGYVPNQAIYTIITSPGLGVFNTFTSLADGAIVSASDSPTNKFRINYSASSVTLTVVPNIISVTPNFGAPVGGGTVVIAGTGFLTDIPVTVTFGGISASFAVDSSTQITATSPAGAGKVDVVVTTFGGSSTNTSADDFSYVPTVTLLAPATGPAAGGTSVVITGSGFTASSTVSFGSNPATSVTFMSSTQLDVVSPAGTGLVDVVVTTTGGSNLNTANDDFTYTGGAAPTAPIVTVNGFQSIVAAQPSGFATFSRILTLELTFNTAVTSVDPGAFSLFNGTDTLTNNGAVSVAGINSNVITLTFTGTNNIPGEEFYSLADGIWTLTTDLSLLNGVGGASNPAVTNNIRRLFGDVNGTGTVDGGDFGLFGSTFGLNDQDPSFNAQFDVNADGSINGGDFGPFGSRFGTGL